MKQFLWISMVAGLAALLPMASPANGQFTITQTDTFSGTPSFVRTMTFDLFDPCAERQCGELGSNEWAVLDSVEITLWMAIHDGYHHVDNDGEGIAWPTVKFGAGAGVLSTDVSVFPAVNLDVLNEKTFGDPCLAIDNGDGAVFDPCGPDGATFYGDPCVADSISELMAALAIPSFIGLGTFDVDVDADASLDLQQGGSGGVSGQYAPVNVDGFVEIVYTYHCVPEPATVGLLCLGAGALLRRRRRRL